MVRRMTQSQYYSMIRQAEQKRRQEINKYNQAVRKHNQNVKRAVDNFNREVRTYNARVRTNRQRVINELNRLKSQSRTTQYKVFRTSVQTLHTSYERLESQGKNKQLTDVQNFFYDLSEREAANNLQVMNSLLAENDDETQITGELQNIKIVEELNRISPELNARYRGAVFSLSPQNPDAARHFCTSTREIITKIINLKAPDNEVIQLFPNCDRTQDGKPTRRSKIKYFLNHKQISDGYLEDFVDSDVDNIIELFKVFNEGTHGGSDTYSHNQLLSIKTRVEDGILFLCELVN